MATTITEKELPVSPLSILDPVGSDRSHVVIARKISKFPVVRFRDGELLETLPNTEYVVIAAAKREFHAYAVWNVTVTPRGEVMAFTGHYTSSLEEATEVYKTRLIRADVFSTYKDDSKYAEASTKALLSTVKV
jgi:hypothetical protein